MATPSGNYAIVNRTFLEEKAARNDPRNLFYVTMLHPSALVKYVEALRVAL